MANFFLFQDTLKSEPEETQNTLQFLEEQDVVVPKKKKKYFIKQPETSQVIDSLASFSSTSQTTILPQKNDTLQKIIFTKSIFGNHLLIQKESSPNLRPIENHNWITLVISFAVVLLIMLRTFSRKKFNSNFKMLFSGRAVTQMMREERAFMNRASFSLSICFLIVLPLFLFQVTSYFGISAPGNTSFNFYLKIAGTIVAAYAMKIIVLKAVGFVFEADVMMNENIFSIFLFSEMLGIFLLPAVIGIAFVESIPPQYFIYSGLGLWTMVFIYRNFRGWISRSAEEQVSKFYLLLYLCALEILPLLVLIKLLDK